MSEVSPVLAAELSALSGIRHGFFTREGGVSKGLYAGLNTGLGSGDERTDVVENRKRIATCLGVDEAALASPYQVHSSDVVTVTDNFGHERPKVDGIVTATPGLALGIVTADCGPVLFAEAEAGVIGACHAGWKGALNGVMENTIAAMEKLSAKRNNIIAVLGPCISQANYEVGPDFPAPFLAQDEANKTFFIPSEKTNHHMFDMVGYILRRLEQSNVKAKATRHCTYALDEQFYSYRRTTHKSEPDYGRQLSAIVMR